MFVVVKDGRLLKDRGSMMNKFVSIYIVGLMLLFQTSMVWAEPEQYRGKVLKFNGDVEVINAKGEKRSVQKVNEQLNEMDTIVTKQGARVVVQIDDGALSVLDEQSRLRVEKTSWFSYLGGKVYFTFKKVFGPPRQVKTRAATIGIRGTTFIISENSERNGESVALKEGRLQIESTGPAFEIHKKKVADEFEQYKLQRQQESDALQKEFEQYRRQTSRDFIEYRRSFILQPDRVINLSGYRIDETAMTPDNEADFEAFEAEAEELIKTFRGNVEKVKNGSTVKPADDVVEDF